MTSGSSLRTRCMRDPSPRPLAELVLEKTGGNPFFAIQFLTALAEQGLLRSIRDRTWFWDFGRIHAKDIPITSSI